MSSKNLLQEYCQRTQRPMPVYQSTFVDNGWTSSVSVGAYTIVRSTNTFNKKRDAEAHCASLLLDIFKNENDVSDESDSSVIVDENMYTLNPFDMRLISVVGQKVRNGTVIIAHHTSTTNIPEYNALFIIRPEGEHITNDGNIFYVPEIGNNAYLAAMLLSMVMELGARKALICGVHDASRVNRIIHQGN